MKVRKKLLQKHDLQRKEKIHIMNFSDKEDVEIVDSPGSKRRSFSWKKVGRKILLSIYKN